MALYRAHCGACDYEKWLAERPHCYVLGDGSELDFVTQYAWCLGCAEVVEVEWFPAKEEVEACLEHLLQDDLDIPEYREYIEQQAGLELTWRKTRHSPPRCLSCGSIEFLLFQINLVTGYYEPLPHLGCSGQLILKFHGFGSLGTRLLYTPEGEPLGDDLL